METDKSHNLSLKSHIKHILANCKESQKGICINCKLYQSTQLCTMSRPSQFQVLSAKVSKYEIEPRNWFCDTLRNVYEPKESILTFHFVNP